MSNQNVEIREDRFKLSIEGEGVEPNTIYLNDGEGVEIGRKGSGVEVEIDDDHILRWHGYVGRGVNRVSYAHESHINKARYVDKDGEKKILRAGDEVILEPEDAVDLLYDEEMGPKYTMKRHW